MTKQAKKAKKAVKLENPLRPGKYIQPHEMGWRYPEDEMDELLDELKEIEDAHIGNCLDRVHTILDKICWELRK